MSRFLTITGLFPDFVQWAVLPLGSWNSTGKKSTLIATLRAWYRSQIPLNPVKIRQIPPPWIGPRKSENMTDKMQKWPQNYRVRFFGNFFVFSSPNALWGNLYVFFVIFSYFRDSGVLWSVPGLRRRNTLRKGAPSQHQPKGSNCNSNLSGPNCAMQPRCAMRFESRTRDAKKFFSPAMQMPAMQKIGMFL